MVSTSSSVSSLRPNSKGHTLVVKVLETASITERKGKAAPSNSMECLVGDVTGTVVLVARNEQVDLVKKGATLELLNAKVEMQRGSMKVVVDSAGKILAAPGGVDIKPKADYNVSLIEFEVVTLGEIAA